MTANETLQLGIYNRALRHLGLKKITSLTGSDPSTVACNDFFESCRDDVFSEHQWAFANVTATLNPSTIVPPVDWVYAYDYPTQNCAAVWLVYNEGNYKNKNDQEFTVSYNAASDSKLILTNCDDAYYEYTYIVSTISHWSAKFIMALSHRLAAEIAPFLADDKKALEQMNIYMAVISEVKRIDASNQIKKPAQACPAQEARG
jgi:dihydroneopterin aldolase